jgi:hypothetical protein
MPRWDPTHTHSDDHWEESIHPTGKPEGKVLLGWTLKYKKTGEIAQGTAQNHRDALDAMRIARVRLLGGTLD